MPAEVRLLGTNCNISCDYCYQQAIRDAGNRYHKYDIAAVIEQLEIVGKKFHMFGGEALLVPKKDLRTMFEYGFKKHGSNGVQTNGTLIDDEHIAMFKEFNVSVGFSIDGPGELNMLRWAGSREKTLATTDLIINNIKKVKAAGLDTGVIITLHRLNGSRENLPKLLTFMRELGDNDIKVGNIHTLEVDATMKDQEKHVLTQEENAEAFMSIIRFLDRNKDLRYNPFNQMSQVLEANDNNTLCYWNNCDPLNTNAVYGIEGDGSLSNCGRTAKEGIDWYKADDQHYTRYISFYYTPDEMGGCQGCRFWIACGGSCPGEAQNNDYRNKTMHCHTMKTTLSHYELMLEARGIQPITKSPELPLIEAIMLEAFKSGQNITVNQIMANLESEKRDVLEVPVFQEGEEVTI